MPIYSKEKLAYVVSYPHFISLKIDAKTITDQLAKKIPNPDPNPLL